MAQIQKGTTYITGDQVTAANLNALADSAILLPGAITDQTAKTVPLAADTVLIHSAADTALRKSTLTQLFANATGIPLTTGVTGTLPVANGGTGITSLGSGIATFLGTPSSANLAAALTDETGSGAAVFATSPTLVTPILGTPASGTLTNCTFPTLNQNTTGSAATLTTPRGIYGNNFDGSAALTQVIASTYGGTGNGFAKFSGPASSEKTFTLPNANATLLYDGGALGTPASGTVTNLTGTASININGTVGATTKNTVAGTTGTFTGGILGSEGMRTNGAFLTNLASSFGFDYFSNTGRFFIWDGSAASTIAATITSTGLNSTAIGATTASTGAFTTLSASTSGSFSGAGLPYAANSLMLRNNGTGDSQLWALGPNTSTNGTMTIVTADSDGSATATVGVFSSTGLAVTGALSSTSNATIGQVTPTLTLGNQAGNYASIINLAGSNIDRNWRVSCNQYVGNTFEITPSTAGGGTTFTTPAVVVNYLGNVGIGTTSPAANLHVEGTQKLIKSVVVNSSTQTIVTNSSDGIAGLCWIRNADVGGQALVLWDASFGLTIVSQLGSIFTTSSPSATEIQLSLGGSSPYYVQAITGATRNGNTLRTSAINNH